jgi:hypothetical protein
MGPGTTWYFRRFAVARPRQKMEGGPKCNEPQGPIFLKKKWVGAVERRDAFHFSGRKGEGDATETSTEERGEAASSIVSHRQAVLGVEGAQPPAEASQKRYSVNNALRNRASFASRRCRLFHRGRV